MTQGYTSVYFCCIIKTVGKHMPTENGQDSTSLVLFDLNKNKKSDSLPASKKVAPFNSTPLVYSNLRFISIPNGVLHLSSRRRSHRERFLVKEKKENKIINLHKASQEAEQRAKERDTQIRTLVEDMEALTGEKYYIGKMKNPLDRVKFAQFIQENWLYLREKKYLSNEEKNFLIDIQCNISFRSNAIVDSIKSRTPNALTINSIAEVLGTSRPKISRIVNSLIKKGLFSKAISGDIKHPTKAKDYVLFVNPHIIYSGSKQKIEEHLILQFKNQTKKNDILKELPIKLF